jgi:hypothetical protein
MTGAIKQAVLLVLTSTLVLAACPGEAAKRDLNDRSPPGLRLTVTASNMTADGLETLTLGQNVSLKGRGGSALIVADDDDGVAWVELWLTTSKACDGVLENPNAATGPAQRVEGTVTPTDAPSSLTAGYDINLLSLTTGCIYTFDVWGKAANAATTAVTFQSPHSKLTLET